MFGKYLKQVSAIGFYFIALGCAKPNYVQKAETNFSPQQAQKADCSLQFNNSKLCLQILWQESIVVGKPTTAILKVYRPSNFDASPVYTALPLSESEKLSLVLWMPSMNHGSAPTKLTLPAIDTGTYLFTDIVFIMSGPWEVQVKYWHNNQVVDEAQVNIDVF